MLLAVLITAAPAIGDAPAPEEELQSVRARLEALREAKRQDLEQRDFALGELRETERALTGLNGELAQLEQQVAEARARRADANRALGERAAALAAERARLAQALAARYRVGPAQPVRVLFSQEDPAALRRMLTYQEYLAQHQGELVGALAAALRELRVLRSARDREDARLAALARERRERQSALEQVRAERTALVQSLEETLRETEAQIGTIAQREQELLKLIEDLARLFSDSPAAELEEPFASRKGRLDWPVEGRLAADYGDSRAGRSLRWNGLMIAADRGAPVRAVAHGRVAYADWLPGLGLLLILEHGEGYLSLYGHNETLLREVGDWVTPGEEVATVGDSGALQEPGLYFEIRKGRKQQNPQRWFTRRIGR
ncbi:MAG: peptidoglycan DD-metalloendopeptidase family protein [Pseudomonadota bacterium]